MVDHPLRPFTESRSPDTVFLFALCILAGFSQLAAGSPPGSVERLLPTWAALLWGIGLVLAGGLVLVGALRTDIERGERMELVGRCMFGPFALCYGVALFAANPDHLVGLLAMAPFVGFGFSCAWRARQIIRRIRRALDSLSRS